MSAAKIIPLEDLGAAELERWRELASGAIEPNPFFHPDFVMPAFEALRERSASVLIVPGDGWRACLPIARTRGWHKVPLPGVATWRHLYCFLGVPLIRADAPATAATELLRASTREGGPFLGLDLVDSKGPVAKMIRGSLAELDRRPISFGRFQRAALRRRGNGRYVKLARKHEREIARQGRRLAEALGGELELRNESDDPDAADRFLALEASGWKGREGTAMASIPAHSEMFREICARFARQSMLELLALRGGGRTVAMLCNFIAADQAFTFKIAFDEEYARYSPGIQIEVRYTERFHSHPFLKLADSCAEPRNEMINRLWPDRREIEILAIPDQGVSGQIATPVLRGIGRLRRKRTGQS